MAIMVLSFSANYALKSVRALSASAINSSLVVSSSIWHSAWARSALSLAFSYLSLLTYSCAPAEASIKNENRRMKKRSKIGIKHKNELNILTVKCINPIFIGFLLSLQFLLKAFNFLDFEVICLWPILQLVF